jgi:cobalt/nickel transport system permease protein
LHIAEGILPAEWAAAWAVPAAVGAAAGLRSVRARTSKEPAFKSLVALMGAAVFAISLMPIPVPVAGSVSHPAGTPLAAVVVGPMASVLLASISLLIQALFFAHGGITTLGANIVSEGMVGSLVGFGVFFGARRLGVSLFWAGFLAGLLGDLAVYVTTAVELGLGLFPAGQAVRGSIGLFVAFMPTQLPLAILEGVFTGGVLATLAELRPDIASGLGLGSATRGSRRDSAPARLGWARRRWRVGGAAARVALAAAAVSLFGLVIFGLVWAVGVSTGDWVGIDEGVMERVAEEQGRPARTPFINTDVGDLLLFVFFGGALVAGGLIGWVVRGLLGGRVGRRPDASAAQPRESGRSAKGTAAGRTRRYGLWGAAALVVGVLVGWAWLAPGSALGPLTGSDLRSFAHVVLRPSEAKVISTWGGDVTLFLFMIGGLIPGLALGWWSRGRMGVRGPQARLPHLHTHDVDSHDRHAWEARGLGGIDARIKLAAAGILLGVNLVAGPIFSLVLLVLSLAASTLIIRVRLRTLAVRMIPAVIVSVMLIVLRGLTVPGEAVLTIHLPVLDRLVFSAEGIRAGAEAASVVLAGVSLLLLLGSSTPLPSLLSALRWYRVPALLIDLGMLMYRYLFLFVEETQRMRQAQKLRGPDIPWRRAMGGFTSLGAHVLIRSYDRSGRVYDAQRLRGGEGRS